MGDSEVVGSVAGIYTSPPVSLIRESDNHYNESTKGSSPLQWGIFYLLYTNVGYLKFYSNRIDLYTTMA